MAGPPTPTVIAAGVSCIMTNCNSTTNSCVYACVIADQPLSPSPPSPPHSLASSSQSHMAPFLIAAVCILGISFLLLTTCTIILRWRFTRHRRRRGNSNGNSPIDGDDGDISVVDHPIWHITTVGLQQSVIDSITAFKYKKLDHFLTEGSDCTVCLTQFEEGDDLRLLPKCSHAFHLSCIDMWLRSHKNCPLCRAPLVNEGFTGSNLAARSERWNNRQDTLLGDSEFQGILGSGRGESSSGHRGDDFGELPVEGIRIAEILKKNRELRIHSDLGVYYRFRRVDEEDEAGEGVLEPIKRSFSFNAVAASAICGEVSKGNEGLYLSSSSGNAGVVVPERKLEIENVVKRGNSMSGLLMIKSSSIVGRSLQKGPVSMKRSVSSGSKLFSFRRTKSQASILPL